MIFIPNNITLTTITFSEISIDLPQSAGFDRKFAIACSEINKTFSQFIGHCNKIFFEFMFCFIDSVIKTFEESFIVESHDCLN